MIQKNQTLSMKRQSGPHVRAAYVVNYFAYQLIASDKASVKYM